ncbi:hypothetical protein BT96DRAFT_610041 [Gymnopus androsaceus JB14]|uniref:Peptidase A1 domain-containing protein n=1 Tax=Gymnopus androsaceus JB14 TaxID=1447944 RepID=A0A6A4HT19_9AGAR|nr:hypothetical protein BT96DRAFT_610041 [Gymnopus androsaceus JB14]
MHFKSAYLIISLVSVACAVPLLADSGLEARMSDKLKYTCTFLQQGTFLDQTSLPAEAKVVDQVPERLKLMVAEFVRTSLDELGTKMTTGDIKWQFLAYDDSYQKIAEGSPVYFELTGGRGSCKKRVPGVGNLNPRPCIAFVKKDSGGSLQGIVTRPSGDNIVVKGDALLVAGVFFTKNKQVATGLEMFDAHTHAQAENMVKWALNQPELKTHLGSQSALTISFSNQFPYKSIPPGAAIGFQFFGGKLCTLSKPCRGEIQLGLDHQKMHYVKMISTKPAAAFEIGAPLAEVSFTKFAPHAPEKFIELADTLAKRLVTWLLAQPNVFRVVGFSKSPIVVNLDKFPYEVIEKESVVHFQFYGGDKCTPVKPCYALVGINHNAEPHPLRYGSVYDYNYSLGFDPKKQPIVSAHER